LQVIRLRGPSRRREGDDLHGQGILLSSRAGVRKDLFNHTRKVSSVPKIQTAAPTDRLQRRLDRTSRLLLLFPLVNLTVILPLSIYRVLALSNTVESTPQGLAVCGSIFSLGGLANVVLYSFTRVSKGCKDHSKSTRVLAACARPDMYIFQRILSFHTIESKSTAGCKSESLKVASKCQMTPCCLSFALSSIQEEFLAL
jgi:hypothetical protein